MDKERIIQEFVPGKQVTLAHLIAHPGAEEEEIHLPAYAASAYAPVDVIGVGGNGL